MSSSDTHEHNVFRSSVYDALLSLTPPSPILTPGPLAETWSSGEIPIILDTSGAATDGSDSPLDTSSTGTCNLFNVSVSSSLSQESVGTFGFVNKRSACWTNEHGTDLISQEDTETQQTARKGAADKPSYNCCGGHITRSNEVTSSPDGVFDTVHSPGPSFANSWFAFSCPPPQRSCFENLLSGEVSLSESGTAPDLHHLVQEDNGATLAQSRTLPRSGRTVGSHCGIEPSYRTHRRAVMEPFQFPARPRESDTASHSLIEEIPISSFRSVNSVIGEAIQAKTPLTRQNSLPESHSWLKDTTVQILIDQEGFRTAQPTFRLAGYSSQGRIDVDGQTPGAIAEFMPVQRQSFNFHYAPFDGLPVLRRITANGQDSRDYTTRQASLSIKSNGVYTVRGVEAACLPATHAGDMEASYGAEPLKMRWKFDYLVDDRKCGTSGRILDGEKTLTPLTFSCSPLLLHPSQGKKIKLMHLVRKSVIPNLIAEKMEPPKSRIKPVANADASVPEPVPRSNSPILGHGILGNEHKRAGSHTPSETSSKAYFSLFRIPNRSMRPTWNLKDLIADVENNNCKFDHTRRRRASSAGERGRAGLAQQYVSDSVLRPVHFSAPAHVQVPLLKHIIPRSQLTEMLNSAVSTPNIISGIKPLTPFYAKHSGTRAD